MSLLQNSNAISAGGYDVNNSLRFRSSASAYLSRTPASTTNQKTWTWSGWVKRGALGSEQAIFATADTGVATGSIFILRFTSTDIMRVVQTGSGGALVLQFDTTAVFRDPGAWYHVVLYMDTTQATNSNGIKIYVNNNLQAGTYVAYTQNTNTSVNSTSFAMYHGRYGSISPTAYFDGYLAEVNFIDGQALTPSSFGETDTTTGVWKPKAYTSTYGTNGFYLKFSDIATTSGSNAGLGKDFSGNSNYWTTNNISVTSGTTYDAMTDSPTNTSATVANYATLNPLDKNTNITISNGNLAQSNSTNISLSKATFAIPSSGAFYWEIINGTLSSSSVAIGVGIGAANSSLSSPSGPDQYDVQFAASTAILNAGSSTTVAGTCAAGAVLQVAADATNGKVWVGKDNSWYDSAGGATGNPSTGANPTFTVSPVNLLPIFYTYNNSLNVNFGQRPFAYTPPTGFVALNTYNLPTPTILQGNKYMDATLYTGNGATRSITNDGSFKPDFVWIKARSIAYFHRLADSVRGTGKELYSNDTGAETTNQADGYVSAFNSNGFSILGGAGVNLNANTFVAWQWQAGQGSTSSNTSGTITSTVSVNATAGFSVVTFNSGTAGNKTVGHGLGVKPAMLILKNRDSGAAGSNWQVWHQSFSNQAQNYLSLNTTSAVGTDSRFWANTAPTSTVFSFESAYTFLASNNIVAYCWAEIAGFSRFGSYTGNGSADGPFVFTNLKARFIMIKRTDSTSNWTILDTAREGYNVDNDPLYPNLPDAEGTTDLADILSNGFKLRSTDASVNANAGTYIYACFATDPFSTNNRAR